MSRTQHIALGASVATLALGLLTQLDRPSEPRAAETPAPQAAQDATGPAGSDDMSYELAFTSFDEWLAALPRSNSLDGTQLEQGVAIARQRGEEMRQLMRRDPDAALERALSYADYHRLPREIQPLVERPFTNLAEIEILAICDHDPLSPELALSLQREDRPRTELLFGRDARVTRSKRNLPAQGIELEELALVRPQAIQRLRGADAAWALATLPVANSDVSRDFLTGEPILRDPVLAVSGGYAFAFARSENVDRLDEALRELDELPGFDAGSSALFATLAKRESKPFSLDAFLGEQRTLALAPDQGPKSYLVIRVDFADHVGAAFEPEELQAMVQGIISPALNDFSYGKTDLDLSIDDTVRRLDNAATYATTDALYDAAIAAHIAGGNVDPRLYYDFIAVSFPRLSRYEWAGLAAVGGQRQWLNGRVQADTILHELGHNYGLRHASYWRHETADPLSLDPVDPSGSREEYGDFFDVMGEGLPPSAHFHMLGKKQLGWIEESQWLALENAEDSGLYRIYAFDGPSSSGLQTLRIRKQATADYYWIGFRQRYPGVGSLDRGAYLIWQKDAGSYDERSHLIDTTPGSSGGKVDAGIAVGRTYADLASQVYITPIEAGRSESGAYLDIAVRIGESPGNASPTGSLQGLSEAVARSAVSFSVAASDPDGDLLAYHWDFGDQVVETNAPAIDHRFPAGGQYELRLTISDMKGGSTLLTHQIDVSDPLLNRHQRAAGLSSKNLLRLATDGAIVIAAGEGGEFLRSEDGRSWTRNSLGWGSQNVAIYGIHRWGTHFIAVGRDYDFDLQSWIGVAYSSIDGITWGKILQTNVSVGDWGFTSVAVNDEDSLCLATGSDGRVYIIDHDGDWTAIEPGSAPIDWSHSASLCYGDGQFVLGGYDFANHSLVLRRSADGVNWEHLELTGGLSTSSGVDTLRYLDGRFLGSGFNARVLYSDDFGGTWSTSQVGDVYRARAIAFGDGLYSAFATNQSQGNAPLELLSSDGRNWIATNTDANLVYNDRIYFKNTFISVGDHGLIHQTDPILPAATEGFPAWIVGYISSEQDQASQANPDNDWAPNFLEYALGSDPSDPASAPRPPQLFKDHDGNIAVSIYRFRKTEVELSIEISQDLANWQTLPTSAIIDSETELRLISESVYKGSLPFFVRVKAAL